MSTLVKMPHCWKSHVAAQTNFHAQSDYDNLTFSNQVVEDPIDRLNSDKVADKYGLAAEHLKAAKHRITPMIKQIFNQRATCIKRLFCPPPPYEAKNEICFSPSSSY